MKFKKGDLVRVRNNLVVGSKYGNAIFTSTMQLFEGRIYLIESVDEEFETYALKWWKDWGWTEEMLEKVKPEDFIKQFLEDSKEILKNYDITIKPNPQILDEDEKHYLSNVIRPFRDRVLFIKKSDTNNYESIRICLKSIISSETQILFPLFKKNTMYKGMEVDKAYTLEELGL